MLELDWYQGTLLGVTDVELVASRLLLGSGALALRPGGAGYNRPSSLRGETDYGGSIALYYGPGLDVHVLGSGAAAPHVAAVLREHFPAHTVSRADVAIDFDAPGAFDRVWQTVHRVASEPRRGGRGGRASTSLAGDWLDGLAGRTFYAGSAGGALRARVYEKGHEMTAKHPDQGPFSLNWARLEWEVRPRSNAKRRAATATVEELAAWTPFGAAVLRAVAGLDLEATAPVRVASTDPLYWCVRAYGKHLRALIASEPELTIAEWLVREESRVRVSASA